MPGISNDDLPYSTIGTDEAKTLIEQGVRVIDVRQPEEWATGHIAQATLVPIDTIYAFGKALKDLNIPEDEAVIFVVDPDLEVLVSGARIVTYKKDVCTDRLAWRR